MGGLPTGTVTFLFTDIQGSTRLWQSFPEQMRPALARHDALMREAIERHGGHVFKTIGDAFCAAFPTALEGLEASIDSQLLLGSQSWETPAPILVRAALHTGEAEERNNDYFGQTLNRVARLLAIGHGGQVLLSLVTAELVRDILPAGVALRDMGEQRLKDLTRPEAAFQVLHPSLPDHFAPLNSLDLHPHNLPTQLTPLVGREKELASIETLLRDRGTRVVTLTGPGGMGKTRLALQAAADLIESFRHGVFFVDLSAVTEPGPVLAAIARVVRVQESPRHTLLEDIAESLRGKQILLILDNFEQVMDAAVHVAALIAACPQVTFVVTSRESLSLRGEKVYSVPPLSLPPRVRRAGPLQALSQYESVRLFIERASEVNQEFHITDDNAPSVAEICFRLDGMPLAIELAAARVRLLPPAEILKRLDNRLRLLTSGARDLPVRQRTLRATIDWSYELLEEPLRVLLRNLSVFAGSFSLEASESLCGVLGTACADALDGLDSLVSRSLLVRDEGRSGTRFRMLETIREYAREKLMEDPAAGRVSEAHAACFLAIAEGAAFHGAKQKRFLEQADADGDNFRATLAWFAGKADPVRLARLCVALVPFWEIRCLLQLSRHWCARAAESAGQLAPDLRARLFHAAGVMARQRGDYEEALKHLGLGLELAGADEALRARIEADLGKTIYKSGNMDDAARRYTAAMERARRAGKAPITGDCLLGLGLIAWRTGRLDEAMAMNREAHSLFLGLGYRSEAARAMNNTACIQSDLGDYAKALRGLDETRAIFEDIGDWDDLRKVYNNLADVSLRTGDRATAARYYERLIALARARGDQRYASTAAAGLADVRLSEGNLRAAAEYAGLAFDEARDAGPGVELGVAFRVRGDVALAEGREAEAEESYANAVPILREAGETEELEKARRGRSAARPAGEKGNSKHEEQGGKS